MTTKKTAAEIFAEAFTAWRSPRSSAYRLGVMQQLRYRMKEADSNKCPFAEGSAECDAFWAGVSEAWNLIRLHSCDRRAGNKPAFLQT